MNDARLYALKAHALLLPSPFATLDPKGEPARRKAIVEWLEREGLGVDDADRKLLAECADEAHDALVQLPVAEDAPEDAPLLLHPLSARPVGVRARVLDAEKLLAELLSELPRANGAPDGAWYRGLWRTLMRHRAYRNTPADRRMPDHTVAAHRSLTAALAGARRGGHRPALLAIHVGPVQSFIEAARRTSDLSIGSYTVGFLAFAGAKKLAEQLGPDVLLNPDVSCRTLADRLLFDDDIPDARRPELLRSALMNRVLAVVPDDEHAEELVREVLGAISGTWKAMADAAKDRVRLGEKESVGFDEQIEAHLEIDAVLQDWPNKSDELGKLYERAGLSKPEWVEHATDDHSGAWCGALIDLTERTLAAHRKGLAPAVSRGDQRPKCTVCGLHEQMGPIEERPSHQQGASREFWAELGERLRDGGGSSLQIERGEGLCAVCLTKRFAPEAYFGADAGKLELDWRNKIQDRPILRFPSTASIASAPLRFYLREDAARDRRVGDWLNLVDKLHEGPLKFTPPGNLLRGLGPIGDPSRLLAFDGTWLYEGSYDPDVAWRGHSVREANTEEERALRGLIPKALETFRAARRAVDGKNASAYYAVVVLDVDEMGKWKQGVHRRMPTIREIAPGAAGDSGALKRPLHPALHADLSFNVAALSLDLHAIVDRHLGRLVYHGGDDLLALLPLATALPCLEAIRLSFQSQAHLGERVTISAGVAVSHWHDPLSGALGAARKAEKDAKNAGRDCFAVHADKRSGEDLDVILPWTVGKLDVIPTLGKMLEGGGEERPLVDAKGVYQLREELHTLGSRELRPAFLHRVERLVLQGQPEKSAARELLHGLGAGRIVDLLLFLRLLLREEHGIVTKELIARLPSKESMRSKEETP